MSKRACPICSTPERTVPVEAPDDAEQAEVVARCPHAEQVSHWVVTNLWARFVTVREERHDAWQRIAQLEREKKQAMFRAEHAEGRAARAEALLAEEKP